MRQIKFRAWGGATNEYPAYMVDDIQDKTGPDDECFGDYLDETSAWIVMQFTGLHDKNGKEIWEGDMLYWDGSIYEIQFKNGEWLMVNPGDSQFDQPGLYNIIKPSRSNIEVLGNIYENPELLTNETK